MSILEQLSFLSTCLDTCSLNIPTLLKLILFLYVASELILTTVVCVFKDSQSVKVNNLSLISAMFCQFLVSNAHRQWATRA